MTRKLLCSTAFSAVVLMTLAGCKKSGNPMGGERPPAAVTANQPVTRDVVEWDEYPGRLEAVDMVEVRARVNGYLQSINFKDGAEVKKGDLLFVIDPRPYQAEYDHAFADLAQAQTKLDLASNDLARADRLLKAKAISAEEADSRSKGVVSAEAAIKSSAAMVETAKINLDYTRITAPIDGRISRKMMTEGNLVNGNQGQASLLTTIVSMDPIYCYFDADERAILKYQKLAREGKGGDFRTGKIVCEVELANETEFPHKGVLDFVDNQIDPAMGTLKVRGTFTNPAPEHILQPGFFVRVRVPGSEKYQSLMVPDAAIGTDQGQKFVYVVNDKSEAEYHQVQLGPVMDGLRVIHSGITSNDWVIVNGLMSVRPGAKVNATHAALGETNAPAAAAK